jgi:hypothetical protein
MQTIRVYIGVLGKTPGIPHRNKKTALLKKNIGKRGLLPVPSGAAAGRLSHNSLEPGFQVQV